MAKIELCQNHPMKGFFDKAYGYVLFFPMWQDLVWILPDAKPDERRLSSIQQAQSVREDHFETEAIWNDLKVVN
jgi:hypothetical protein